MNSCCRIRTPPQLSRRRPHPRSAAIHPLPRDVPRAGLPARTVHDDLADVELSGRPLRLWALSDLHISHPGNWNALNEMPALLDDWLLLAGDVSENPGQLDWCFRQLTRKFHRVVWTPGNHELWTRPDARDGLRGVALYNRLVEIARSHGVLTPADPYPLIEHPAGRILIAPLFLLYDYSFRPGHVPADQVIRWAASAHSVCADEVFLHPDPFRDRASWCRSLCQDAVARLASYPVGLPKVLINHFPLEEELAVLPRVPRFTPWCGTRLTQGWHRRFNACAVVYGHLHMRGTRWLDGVPFQEVSLGYPTQWDARRGIAGYLRKVRLALP